MTDRLLRALLRGDFGAFVEKVFQTVATGDDYLPNWHIDAIIHHLSQSLAGETNRLIITQPPRSLKSMSASVAFPAWVLGHDPTRRIICVSYSAELAAELARQFRLVMDSDWYRDVFPHTRALKDAGMEFVTTAGGSRLATSIGGTLTGRGADIIVVDDPMKAEEAGSEAARQRVIDWYLGTLSTRLDDKRKGIIILVMQRLHEDDLVGHVLRSGSWTHLDLPAIAEDDQQVTTGPGLKHYRRTGDVLHPEREPLDVLERIRTEIGSLRFSAQYLQRPVPAEGNLIKRDWLGVHDSCPSGEGVRIIQSWDVATTATESGDASAVVTAAIANGKIYVIDVWHGRLSYPDLKRRIIAEAQQHRPQVVLIERAGPGVPLVQDLGNEHYEDLPTPIGIVPEGDKVVRLEAASPVVERGDVLLPREAPWLGSFLEELLGFPHARHDDQVDAFSQLVNWHKNRWHEPRVSLFGPIIIRG